VKKRRSGIEARVELNEESQTNEKKIKINKKNKENNWENSEEKKGGGLDHHHVVRGRFRGR